MGDAGLVVFEWSPVLCVASALVRTKDQYGITRRESELLFKRESLIEVSALPLTHIMGGDGHASRLSTPVREMVCDGHSVREGDEIW